MHHSTIANSAALIYCQFIFEVHLSVARAENEIYEKSQIIDHFKDLGYVLLPNCMYCLLRLDERFTGIALPGGYHGEHQWHGSKSSCATCRSVESSENTCRHCHSSHDIW